MTSNLSVKNILPADFRSWLERMFFQEAPWVALGCCTMATLLTHLICSLGKLLGYVGAERGATGVCCASCMVLALPQLSACLPAQGDVLDMTNYTSDHSLFSLSMEN